MENNNTNSFRQKIHEIIFEADTTSGKLFDIILLTAILLSIVGVMLESVYEIDRKYHELIIAFEWGFTILFTIEYFFRIYAVNRPFKYIFSFMGIVDLLAIIPTYLIFILPAAHSLSVIRAIRLIRIFRIFKLSRYLRGAHTMQIALRSSRPKIIVFLLSVILLVKFNILGNNYSYYCWLWKYCSNDDIWENSCLFHNDFRLWNYCCSNWYCNSRIFQKKKGKGKYTSLPGLHCRRT